LLPVEPIFDALVFVTFKLPLKILPLKYTSATVAVIFAPKVVPANVKEDAVELKLPFVQLPLLQATTPVVFNENAFKLSNPLVIVKLVTVVLLAKIQLLAPVTITTLSKVPGIPLGVQLEPVFQLVEVLPFQVYET
jgi:hypothetical protein